MFFQLNIPHLNLWVPFYYNQLPRSWSRLSRPQGDKFHYQNHLDRSNLSDPRDVLVPQHDGGYRAFLTPPSAQWTVTMELSVSGNQTSSLLRGFGLSFVLKLGRSGR